MNDQQILAGLRSDTRAAALKELYKLYPQVKKFLLKQGAQKKDTRDLFQEALIVFYEKAQQSSFTLTASISTYVQAVARNMLLKKFRDDRVKTSEISEVQGGSVEMPEMELDQPDLLQLLEEVLLELGQRCLDLLRGFYYRKQSMKELSVDLGFANPDAAKRKKYKCMDRAKKVAEKRILDQNLEVI